jgi:hypothetical protein
MPLTKRCINVKLPVELADKVDKVIEKKILGYRSRVIHVRGCKGQVGPNEEITPIFIYLNSRGLA